VRSVEVSGDADELTVMIARQIESRLATVQAAGRTPRVLLTGVPVDNPELHRAIESHGAVVVAEVGPFGSGAAGDDVRVDEDPILALADKYRADSVGARTPAASFRRWTERMLGDVDAVFV
jgi:benzoyl-CoA reductase/2-hydroxyglutaryl-CoA dehydratase subunit BcrC/BadD/HgdB